MDKRRTVILDNRFLLKTDEALVKRVQHIKKQQETVRVEA